MCRTSKPAVASHTRGLSCVCTLTEPLLGNHGHVHKLTVRRFTVQISDLLPPPPCNHPPSLALSILCCCAAGGRRSWSCSSRPVHPSMPPLRVSGAGLLHRPPLSSTLRTLIHTPERRSYLQQHTYTSKHTHTHTHTHTEQSLCMCVLACSNTIGEQENTPYVHLCLCVFCIWDCAYTHLCLL